MEHKALAVRCHLHTPANGVRDASATLVLIVLPLMGVCVAKDDVDSIYHASSGDVHSPLLGTSEVITVRVVDVDEVGAYLSHLNAVYVRQGGGGLQAAKELADVFLLRRRHMHKVVAVFGERQVEKTRMEDTQVLDAGSETLDLAPVTRDNLKDLATLVQYGLVMQRVFLLPRVSVYLRANTHRCKALAQSSDSILTHTQDESAHEDFATQWRVGNFKSLAEAHQRGDICKTPVCQAFSY